MAYTLDDIDIEFVFLVTIKRVADMVFTTILVFSELEVPYYPRLDLLGRDAYYLVAYDKIWHARLNTIR